MGFSYLNARSALSIASAEAARPAKLSGQLSNDLITLERLRKTIHSVEAANDRWFMPWVGFKDGRTAEAMLKTRFIRLYDDKILRPFDSALAAGLDAAVADTLGPERLSRFACIVARIGLIREFTANGGTESFAKFRDSADQHPRFRRPELSPGVGALFAISISNGSGGTPTPRRGPPARRQPCRPRPPARQPGNLRRTALAWIDAPPDIRMSDFWGEIAENAYDDEVVIPQHVYTKQRETASGVLLDRRGIGG